MTYTQWLVVLAVGSLLGYLAERVFEARLKRHEAQHYRDVVLPNLREFEARKEENRSARWHG